MIVSALERLRLSQRLPPWVQYLATALIVFGCFGVRVAIARVVPSTHLPLYLVFIPAITIAAFLFDRGSGFIAVALSGLLGFIYLRDPEHILGPFQSGDVVWLVAFVLIGLFIAATVETLRIAVDRLADRSDELARRSRELTAVHAELLQVSRHRELLLADINHRIKNHLAAVAAGLTLSRSRLVDEEGKAALDEAVRRLDVLGRVYSRLHVTGPEVALDSKDFLEGLCAELAASLLASRPVALIPVIESHELSAQHAVSIGLIVNELVTNAAKYAFPDDQPGNIRVLFGQSEGECTLQVIDDGKGAPVPPKKVGAGVKLVKALVAQIEGSVEWHHAPGTKVKVTLPSCDA